MTKDFLEHITFNKLSVLHQYHMFQRAMPILDSFDSSNNYDLNQVIELSNIVQIVKSIDCPTNITPEKFNKYRKETDAISRFVSYYFQQLDLSDVGTTNGTINGTINGTLNGGIEFTESERIVFEEIKKDPCVTMDTIVINTDLSRRTVARAIKTLTENKVIARIGSKKTGHWEIAINKD